MAQSILTQILSLINLGASLEAAVEEIVPGASVEYWARQIARQSAPAPKKAKKSKKATTTRRTSKRSQYAAMQSTIGLATVELVERVNGSAGPIGQSPQAGEPRFVNGCLEVWE